MGTDRDMPAFITTSSPQGDICFLPGKYHDAQEMRKYLPRYLLYGQ